MPGLHIVGDGDRVAYRHGVACGDGLRPAVGGEIEGSACLGEGTTDDSSEVTNRRRIVRVNCLMGVSSNGVNEFYLGVHESMGCWERGEGSSRPGWGGCSCMLGALQSGQRIASVGYMKGELLTLDSVTLTFRCPSRHGVLRSCSLVLRLSCFINRRRSPWRAAPSSYEGQLAERFAPGVGPSTSG